MHQLLSFLKKVDKRNPIGFFAFNLDLGEDWSVVIGDENLES
jgi:hypothetical protein